MKNLLCLIAAGCVLLTPCLVRAGSETQGNAAVASTTTSDDAVHLDLFKIESGYVFESDLNHGGSFGKQAYIQNEFEYWHLLRITGNWFAHLGVSYDRYDFGSTSAPVPNHLQAIAGVIGVDYMHGNDVGAFFQARPGFYFQNDIGTSSFDVPMTLGRIFVVKDEKFYVFLGAYSSFLRSGFPVLPLGGFIWVINDDVRLMALLPEPKLIYAPTEQLNFWVGGELVGGSYRTDRNDNIRPTKLNGAQIDFSDYRAGVGMTYKFTKTMSVDVGAGVSIQREFNFGRAGETYRTDPSPYVRMQLTAAF